MAKKSMIWKRIFAALGVAASISTIVALVIAVYSMIWPSKPAYTPVSGVGGKASATNGSFAAGGNAGRSGPWGSGGNGGDAVADGNSKAFGGNGGDALQADGTACGGRINQQALKNIPKEMIEAIPNLRDYGKGGDVGHPKGC